MRPVDHVIRSHGFFLRRRDLLALGYTDGDLRVALAQKRIFRARQGWYSVPDAPEAGVRAVRVGGRLTSLSALESLGIPVPRQPRLHVAVKGTASRLRDPVDRRMRLSPLGGVAVHWIDGHRGEARQVEERGGGPNRGERPGFDSRGDKGSAARGTPWRVPVADALLAVLTTETRDVAVACLGATLQARLVTRATLEAVFARAPKRVRGWSALVSGLDESHGETFFRLWFADAGHSSEQQVHIPGIGRFDNRVSPHVYVEIDGAQHDPSWSGDTASSWLNDLDRDAAMAIRGDRVLHIGYRQLYTAWPTVLAAIERAMADDAALVARRRRHPYRPRNENTGDPCGMRHPRDKTTQSPRISCVFGR